MDMKFTLSPGPTAGGNEFFEDCDRASAVLGRAETLGVDGVVVDDFGGLLDNLSLASLISSRTSHLQTIVSHWPGVMTPLAAAMELMSIHNASGGGIALRIGNASLAGSDEPSPAKAGELFHRRTDEYLMLLKRLWTNGRPFDFEGQFYRLRNAHVADAGHALSPISIRMAGVSGGALQVAAKHADTFELPGGTLADTRLLIDRMVNAARPFGRDRKLTFAVPVTPKGASRPGFTGHEPIEIDVADPHRAVLTLLPFVEAGVSEFMIGDTHLHEDAELNLEWMGLLRNSVRHLSATMRPATPASTETAARRRDYLLGNA